MIPRQTVRVLWVSILCAVVAGCASVEKKPKFTDGEMRLVVVDASGGG